MRILFIGSVVFSEEMLRTLIDAEADVVGVITLETSSFNADHADLTPIAQAAGIPTHYASDINSGSTLDWARSHEPDVVFCFGWSRLLTKEFLTLAPLGVVGFHPTALPKNRGRHPLIWSIVLGLKESASTFFFMTEGADTGDIVSQKPFPIHQNDDAKIVYDRVIALAKEQLVELVEQLAAGTHQRIPQDHSLSNSWRKRSKADGEIDWRMSARSIHNLVRGLSPPYPGAHFEFEGQDVKVWRARFMESSDANHEPGKVVGIAEDGPIISTGCGEIVLLDFSPRLHFVPGSYL